MADPIKHLQEQVRELDKLREHPAWPVLKERLKEKRDLHTRRVATLILTRVEAPLVQREIDYISGFWAGAKWLLDNPDLAHNSLEKALRRAQLPDEEEDE